MGPKKNNNFTIGNEVILTGTIDIFNGLIQIKSPTNVEVKSKDNKLPQCKLLKVNEIKNQHQGMFIKVNNIVIKNVNNADKNGSYTIKGNDGTGNIDIRVDGRLEEKIPRDKFKNGFKINVTACLSSFNNKNQLMLSSINNVEFMGKEDNPVFEGKISKINEIQGKAHRSPLEGLNVSKVEGIVTAISNDKYQKGFFMQDPNPDNDPSTSEGIFVRGYTEKVNIGDRVLVDGTVIENVNGLQKDCVPETTIVSNNIIVKNQENSLPEPITIRFNKDLAKNISSKNMNTFDITKYAMDYYESLEGMRVKIEKPVIVGADERYGEICVLANDGEFSKNQRTRYGGIKAYKDDFNPEIITIDDVVNPITNNKTKKFLDPKFKVSVGDKFDDSIIGVVSSGFGKYKVYNTEKLPSITKGNYKRTPTTIEQQEDKITIASYNVENLSKKSGKRIDEIGQSIVTYLKSPDIVGLLEIQDNDGADKSDITDASETYEALVKAIKNAGGPEYGYIDIAPANNEDGGQPGGNIRQGFIYRKDRVKLVENKKGTAKDEIHMTDKGLNLNPGRISPNDKCFANSRKPLVTQFNFKGQDVYVIANHLNSKRGDGSLFGVKQPPINKSEPQRHNQVKLINNFIKEVLAKKPDANIVALGDMNDFEFSKTLDILKGNEMKNMIDKIDENKRFTYVHNGNSQVLDHILVTNNLYEKGKIDIVNLNSQSTEGALSDHDSVIVQLQL